MPELVVLLEQVLAPVPGGVGRYSAQLARALAATAPAAWTVRGVTAAHLDPGAAVLPGVAGPRRLPLPARALTLAWERGVPLWPGGRAVFAPSPLAPPRAGAGRRLVVAVHDCVAWTHPQTLTPRGRRWHRTAIRRATRVASAVVVPTAAVADELAHYAPGPAPVHVLGAGVAAELAEQPSAAATAEVTARLRLPQRYVLAIGTLEPRKGLDVLIEALAAPGAPVLPLLLVGARGWGGVDAPELARRAGLPPSRLRVLGAISDTDLAVVLRRATVLAAPSLAEGFGLPVLEAMTAGVPVVHSDAPALVEVAAGSGVAVPRGDAGALAAALHTVAADRAVAERMRRDGSRRAADFGWERCAGRLWALCGAIGAAG